MKHLLLIIDRNGKGYRYLIDANSKIEAKYKGQKTFRGAYVKYISEW